MSIDFERDAKPEARKRGGGQPTVLEIVEAAPDMSDVTVVLFTGDEHAALREQLNDGKLGRFELKARHNVPFEAGLEMALPKGRERTILMSPGTCQRVRVNESETALSKVY